jgi:hypothetical protein
MSASFWLEAGLSSDTGAGAATDVNNQTTGTRAAFLDWQGNRIAWTYPAYHRGTTSLAEETNWIKPC